MLRLVTKTRHFEDGLSREAFSWEIARVFDGNDVGDGIRLSAHRWIPTQPLKEKEKLVTRGHNIVADG